LLLRIRSVARYAKEQGIDVIHAHLPWAGIVARLVGKITGIPVIYTEHNKQERYHFLTRNVNLATFDMTRAVVAVSADVAASIRKYKPSTPVELVTVLNGVNTEHFVHGEYDAVGLKEQLGIPAHSPVIGTIAVFRNQKRLDVFLRLAVEILKKSPEAHFVIVGDGPLKVQLLTLCGELGIPERVHFPGLQTEVRPYLNIFDVYMMTSVFEGLPIALLEAMSMGCPVVSTQAGGVAEVVRNEVDGLTCPVDQPENLVALTLSLLGSDSLRHRYSAAARARVVDSFSLVRMVRELEQLYNRIAIDSNN
jgi:glycosyltransferase involved in cell wall biosynthesis